MHAIRKNWGKKDSCRGIEDLKSTERTFYKKSLNVLIHRMERANRL